jgi:1,4-dihydroxy-2-naphthoate octaprenyltransferase
MMVLALLAVRTSLVSVVHFILTFRFTIKIKWMFLVSVLHFLLAFRFSNARTEVHQKATFILELKSGQE